MTKNLDSEMGMVVDKSNATKKSGLPPPVAYGPDSLILNQNKNLSLLSKMTYAIRLMINPPYL